MQPPDDRRSLTAPDARRGKDLDRLPIIPRLGKSVSVAHAASVVPSCSGLYAISVDDPRSLPDPFRSILQRRRTRLIYVGVGKLLRRRLIEQDLRHRGRSTFFRSLGAVLKFRPEFGSLRGKRNQCNFTFSRTDTARIIEWIDARLAVGFVEHPLIGLRVLEQAAIDKLKPVFNIKHNPEPVPELLALRAECLRIARGVGSAADR